MSKAQKNKRTPEQVNYQKIYGLAHVIEAICGDLEVSTQMLQEDIGHDPIAPSEEQLLIIKNTFKKLSHEVAEIQGYVSKIKKEL